MLALGNRTAGMVLRTFLTATLAFCAIATQLLAQTQQTGRIRQIGILAAGPSPWLITPFVSSLHELGWVEGRDFILEPRYTGAAVERAAALANELIERKVDLILVINTANAQAASRASRTVPIVMLVSGFPVEAGLAASLARPGGNVTGLSIYAGGGLFAKYVQLLKELVPDLRNFTVLWDYIPPGFVKQEADAFLGEMKRAASAVGVTARVFEIGTRGDLARAIAVLRREHMGALFVTNGPVQRRFLIARPPRYLTPSA